MRAMLWTLPVLLDGQPHSTQSLCWTTLQTWFLILNRSSLFLACEFSGSVLQKLVVVEPSGQICAYRALPALWGVILPLSGLSNPDLSTPSGPAGVLSIDPHMLSAATALQSQLLSHQSSQGPRPPQEECGSLSSPSGTKAAYISFSL